MGRELVLVVLLVLLADVLSSDMMRHLPTPTPAPGFDRGFAERADAMFAPEGIQYQGDPPVYVLARCPSLSNFCDLR